MIAYDTLPEVATHSEAWHRQRQTGIGGSDASVVMGRNPWKDVRELWEEKVAADPIFDAPSEAAYWGLRLEPVLLDEFNARAVLRDLVAVSHGPTLRSREWPWMLANVDGLVYEGQGHLTGAPPIAVLEIKTTSAFARGEWEGEGEVAEHALWQVQHNMAVVGVDRAYVVALIGGQRYVERVIERDDDLIDMLVAAEMAFWTVNVMDRIPPVVEGQPEAVPGEVKVATSECVEDVIAYKAAREKAKHYEEVAADLRTRIESVMESAEELQDQSGDVLVTWKQSQSSRFDSRRFKREHPELDEQYRKTVTSRTFLVK